MTHINEIGTYCLVLAFCFSLAQAGVVIAGKGRGGIARYAEGVSLAGAVSILIAFGILIFAFIRSDFSVV
ncbi:MAG TPA: heme lyase NrfEFG subunit NrfE, partial [Asticcacaulis sp.]|nr:heme lyase NrfEFG subunit NrfE [Asticcacaulis sp.]